MDEVAVVVELCVHQCEAGEGAGGQKPRNRVLWLNFRHAM